MPWLWLHTVTDPPSQRAIAQLGAIDACATNGRLNSAVSVRVAMAAAPGSGCSTTGCGSDGAASRKDRRSRSSGSGPGESASFHRAARATRRAARSAARSVSATTPTNEPSCTSRSPRPSRMAGSSLSSAAAEGGRTTRPNSMPGSTRSWMNRGRPVTLSGRSSRGAGRPATVHSAGGRAGTGAPAARSSMSAVASDQ